MSNSTKGGFATVGTLILASSSPRRQKFLSDLGIDFSIETAEIDETGQPGESPEEYVLRLAKEKAAAVSVKFPAAHVLAADTVVSVDDELLGKPEDSAGAERMLKILSGRWHEVWTGFSLQCQEDGLSVEEAVMTRVLFRKLSHDLCRAYILTEEPLDKAGGYGLQGIGGFLVREIKGSYSNVIGLPVSQVIDIMLKYGIISPRLNEKHL